jgi:hypothetical protein
MLLSLSMHHSKIDINIVSYFSIPLSCAYHQSQASELFSTEILKMILIVLFISYQQSDGVDY